MKIKAPYNHGSLMLGGKEIYFQNGVAEVSDAIGRIVLLKGQYTVALNRSLPLSKAKEILVIRESGLGDVLLITPIVRKIKKEINPKANIDWLVSGEFKSLLLGNPYIRNVYTVDTVPADVSDKYQFLTKLNSTEFDSDSWAKHRLDVFASRVPGLGVIKDRHLDYFITDKEVEWAKWAVGNSKSIIALTMTAHAHNRMLKRDFIRKLVSALLQKGYKIVLVDKRKEAGWQQDGVLNFCGKTNIRQAAALLYAAGVVICPDTGIFHIASALDKKILAYFGAVDYKKRMTHDKVKVLVKGVDCYPCDAYGCALPRCLWELKVEDFLRYLEVLEDVKS